MQQFWSFSDIHLDHFGIEDMAFISSDEESVCGFQADEESPVKVSQPRRAQRERKQPAKLREDYVPSVSKEEEKSKNSKSP